MKDQTPEAILGEFEKRVDAMFRAEAGEPLVRAKKQKPLGPERGNYVPRLLLFHHGVCRTLSVSWRDAG